MKPRKPYKSFPLTPHVRGGWGKKYKGRQMYIADPDPDRALREFHRRAKEIDEGRLPARIVVRANATVYDITNRYVVERGLDRDAGRLSEGAWRDYRDAANAMCEAFGDDTRIDDLVPDDFTALFRSLSERGLGAHALGRMIQGCRTILNHAAENEWIDRRPRYGTVFRKPTTDHKQGAGFDAPTIARLIAYASLFNRQLEAMMLLMVNGGFTAKDCAALPRSAFNPAAGVIQFRRPKMRGRKTIDRAMTLWPETADALADVLAERPADDLVFRTIHGNPWVQGQTNSVALIFRRLCKAIGWKAHPGLSWLRHLHRTLADELEKPHAAARLMGHRISGIAETYIDHIEHSRIQQITDHLRARIFPHAPAADPKHPEPSETSPAPADASESPPTHTPPALRHGRAKTRRSSGPTIRRS